MTDALLERHARKLCAQENEIWDEATNQQRRMWLAEAKAAFRAAQEKNDG